MKKLLSTIILGLLILSSSFQVNAANINDIFDYETGPESLELEYAFSSIPTNLSFRDASRSELFNQYRNVTNTLKNGLVAEYRKGNIDYYQMQGLVTAYNNYLYYTNHMFELSSLNQGVLLGDNILKEEILKNYYNSRFYFQRMQYLYKL